MKLKQFDKVGRGKGTGYTTNISDITGAEDYQLVISGSDVRIKKILRDTDFDVKIDPNTTEDDWAAIQKPLWEEQRAAVWSLTSLENVESFFKPQPRKPSIDNSTFISLRRIRGEGSIYQVRPLPYLPLARRQSLIISLPWVCRCFCMAEPLTGDPDLFLSINSPGAVPVASSVLSGTAVDSISYMGFCWPWSNFIPYFRIFAFTNTVVKIYCGGWGTTL